MDHNGKIITVSSVKGGVGKTTLTLNLAGLYFLMKKKVLIIDLDLYAGGIATCLNINNKRDIYMLVDSLSSNKSVLLDDYVTKYNNGISILASPKDPRDVSKIESKYINTIFDMARLEYDIILVDINESPKVASISEVLHLIEPSTIKLNKLIRADRMVLTKMKNYKIVLNKCLLSDKDVKDFEYESRCKVFESIPPLDDKKERNPILNNLLYKMGFDKQTPTGGAKKPVGKLFGIVKDE